MKEKFVHWEIDLEDLLDGLPEKYHSAVKENAYLYANGFFFDVTPAEIKDYRREARDEFTPEKNIDPYWHPVLVDECVNIIKEFIKD